MGTSILRGMIYAIVVSVLALAAAVGIAWFGVGEQYMSPVIDAGLVISCLAAGYGGAYASNRVMPGVLAALAYVLLVVISLSFFYQLLLFGAYKVLTGALLLAVVSALAGKGRAVYNAEREPSRPREYSRSREYSRPYFAATSYGGKTTAKRSVPAIRVEHTERDEAPARTRLRDFGAPEDAGVFGRSGLRGRAGSFMGSGRTGFSGLLKRLRKAGRKRTTGRTTGR